MTPRRFTVGVRFMPDPWARPTEHEEEVRWRQRCEWFKRAG